MCRRARQCVVREHSHVHVRQPVRARQLTVAKTAAHGPKRDPLRMQVRRAPPDPGPESRRAAPSADAPPKNKKPVNSWFTGPRPLPGLVLVENTITEPIS